MLMFILQYTLFPKYYNILDSSDFSISQNINNKNPDLSQPTTFDFQSECLVAIDRGILKKRHTQNYSSKFKKFNSWCNSMENDPYLASFNEIADFLAFLFDEGLQYRKIADECYQCCFHQLLIFQ